MILLFFSSDVLLYCVSLKDYCWKTVKKGCSFAMFCLVDSG